MASHPVHGMLQQETNAGASVKAFSVEDVSAEYIGTQLIECADLAVLNGAGIGVLGPSSTTWVLVGASAAGYSQMRLTAGANPTSPVNGDIWFDGTNLKMRVGGVTKTFTMV